MRGREVLHLALERRGVGSAHGNVQPAGSVGPKLRV
jgi:hypothetical protein